MLKIFALKNRINGKLLIGITETDLRDRYKLFGTNAKRGFNDPVFKDIRLYGIENFELVQMAEAEGDNAIIIANSLIQAYKDHTYNIKPLRGTHRHHTPEHRRLIGLGRKTAHQVTNVLQRPSEARNE